MFKQHINSNILTISTINSQNQITQKPLHNSIKQTLKNYFTQLNNQNINNLYKLILTKVKQPLLNIIIQYTHNNQTHTTLIININHNTLHKKLKKYNIN